MTATRRAKMFLAFAVSLAAVGCSRQYHSSATVQLESADAEAVLRAQMPPTDRSITLKAVTGTTDLFVIEAFDATNPRAAADHANALAAKILSTLDHGEERKSFLFGRRLDQKRRSQRSGIDAPDCDGTPPA